MLEFATYTFEPRDPAEAQTLRRKLPGILAFRHRSFRPRHLADWANGSSYGGFNFERYDSHDERPEITTTEDVAGVPYRIHLLGTTTAAPWWLLLSLFSIAPLLLIACPPAARATRPRDRRRRSARR